MALNLKDPKITDPFTDENGNRRYKENPDETSIAKAKQDLLKNEFAEWIWRDPERRDELVTLYNEKFNAIRPREFNGSHLTFPGMNTLIRLKEYQKNAIAHTIYGGNTLLAHAVGAGKTYEMIASAQEAKRLGLCTKSLFVVPNHLIEQWATEYMRLYPMAHILVSTKKDFEKENRKRFCSRIATGNYDAIILGHSQFTRIPMSKERQIAQVKSEIEDITAQLTSANAYNPFSRSIASIATKRASVKQLERAKKTLEVKLKRLLDSPKDDAVTFEELGVDRLYIDEAHEFKNLFLYTKMRNITGISASESQKATDLFMKCRYIDALTGGKGIVFATGTPISNSMSELYTMQRYLQYDSLKKNGLNNFDAWVSVFCNTETAIELAVDGSFKSKTRFSKFYNLPELMASFKECADIRTAETLHLDVPKANFHNVVTHPSDIQKSLLQAIVERAEKVHNHQVNPAEDNMLKITSDGRKLALDQRLIDPSLPEYPDSKVAACANNVAEIYHKTNSQRSTQLVFCNLSTPKPDGYNVYDDLRQKLEQNGIPKKEIAYIHTADTDKKKEALFEAVRKGKIRVLIGSTAKMGAGTNVQDRLTALHDLDCPWRPSDLEQRLGRIVRQGNQNKEVDIYRYITDGTFDAYMFQLLESKQRFIGQIMTSKTPARSADDIDDMVLSYAEMKSIATGNPLVMERVELDTQIRKLTLLKSNYLNQRYTLENQLLTTFPKQQKSISEHIEQLQHDLAATLPISSEDNFSMTISDTVYLEPNKASKAIAALSNTVSPGSKLKIGSYRGFDLYVGRDIEITNFLTGNMEISRFCIIQNHSSQQIEISDFSRVTLNRIDTAIDGIPELIQNERQRLDKVEQLIADSQEEIKKPFDQEEELVQLSARLEEVTKLLSDSSLSTSKVTAVQQQPEKKSLSERVAAIGKSERTKIQPNSLEQTHN